ncbi:sensor histidine kinase [Puia dinghuensis]|nr:hybrid sensor histidine kinase/response regulator [Puia dinghuensis]
MTNKPVRILILEHDPDDIELLQRELRKGGLEYVSTLVHESRTFEKELKDYNPDIILADYTIPGFDGVAAFNIKKESCPDTPFIIVSGTIGEENAVELIKAGVTDYVLKENLFTVVTKIKRALKEATEYREKKEQAKMLENYARELERSNQELEEFAYIASHDLQEPLRMIGSFLQLLQQKYEAKLDKEANEYIYFAVDGAARMKCLIDDLLNYSRINRDQTIKPVDLSVIINEVLSNLSASINETGALITISNAPVLNADPVQMLQLFQNLIGNAIRYRKEGTRPEINIQAWKEETHWLFAIKDNGIGIESQYSEKIFVIFQQLHGKAENKGTGIGLAIAKKIVVRHGGKIWFESAPGKGTTFYFTIKSENI